MPAKVQSSEEFTINASIDKVRAFFGDLNNISYCIPGCEEVIAKDPKRASVRIKVKLGYVSKSLQMETVLLDSSNQNEITFSGNSEDARIKGRLNFVPDEGGTTKVTYALEVDAVSAMARTAVTFMGKDFVSKQTESFADCVRQKIGSN